METDIEPSPGGVARDGIVDVRTLLPAGALPGPGVARVRTPAPRRGVVVRRVALAVLLLAVAWAGAAVWTLTQARAELQVARDALFDGREALAAADLPGARDRFDTAATELVRAGRRVHSVLALPARAVPFGRRNLDAVGVLTAAAEQATSAGLTAVDAVLAQPGGLEAFAPAGGAVPVAPLAATAPAFQRAAADLARAGAAVAALRADGLAPDVADALASFQALIVPVVDLADTAATLTRWLPQLFGIDGPRRYFVGASNPTESRGTGGFIGAYTILEIDRGQLAFGPVNPIQDLPNLPAGTVPPADPSIAARYDRYGGTAFWQNINMTPDFPAAATAIERAYAAVRDERLDGVIAVDPFAFQSLLTVTGPVEVPGVGTVDADTVVPFVSNEAYTAITDPERRKRLIGEVAAATLRAFLSQADRSTAATVLAAVSEMAARESLLVHAADPQVQAALEELGVAGALPSPAGDLVAVTLNSGTATKVDFYQQRALTYQVALADGGTTVGSLALSLHNGAPTSGQPEYVIGFSYPDGIVGESLSLVSTYCNVGCTFLDVPDAGYQGLPTRREVELGHPAVSTWLFVPAMQSRELLWTLQTPDGWTTEGTDRVYRLTYDHQTTIRPTDLTVSVRVPDGFEPVGMPDGATVAGGAVRWSAAVDRDQRLEFRFRPEGA